MGLNTAHDHWKNSTVRATCQCRSGAGRLPGLEGLGLMLDRQVEGARDGVALLSRAAADLASL